MSDLRPIAATDITWSLPLTPHRERVPGLDLLPPDTLLAFAGSLQADVDSLRITLHEALRALAYVTEDRDRLRRALRGLSK